VFASRLREFIEYQGLSVRSFEEEAQITQGLVSRTIKKNLVLSGENLIKISERWPNLNIKWLLTGEDEMLRGDSKPYNELLKKANSEVLYWKDLADTLKEALKQKNKLQESDIQERHICTEQEAIKLLANYKSKGSNIQKISFEIHDQYIAICKLFKLGKRKPAVNLSENLLETAVYYQEYTIAAELTKYLVNHYAVFDSMVTSNEYMKLYEKYSSMADLEFRARQIFNKVCYNEEHHLETNKQEVEKALIQIQEIMLLDSFNYYCYYYKSKCLLSDGEELVRWATEAIEYFENQYFKHDSIISHFKSILINHYIDCDLNTKAYALLNSAINKSAIGSYAWFKYMYSIIELLAKDGKLQEASQKFELATNQDAFAGFSDDDKRYWEILRKMIYEDESVEHSIILEK